MLVVDAAAALAQTKVLHFVTWKSEAPEVWQSGITDFERQNPGVKVVSEIGPQSSTQLHDLLTQKLKNRDRSISARKHFFPLLNSLSSHSLKAKVFWIISRTDKALLFEINNPK